MNVVGATDGCFLGVVGALTAAVGSAWLVAAGEGVLTGCSVTST